MRNMSAISLSTITNSAHPILQQFASGGVSGAILFLAIALGICTAIYALVKLVPALIRLSHHLRGSFVFLEVTPPETTKIEPLATSALFTLLSGILSSRPLADRVRLKSHSLSCEIISEKDSGIRYVLRVPESLAALIEKNIHAYSTGIKIKRVDDYSLLPPNPEMLSKILFWKLSRPWPLPLSEPENLSHDDPLSYLTGNMSKLEAGEMLALQLVIRPTRQSRTIRKIYRLIRENRFVEWIRTTSSPSAISSTAPVLESIVNLALTPLMFAAGEITGNKDPLPSSKRPVLVATPFESELESMVKNKLSQPLFDVTLRALLVRKRNDSHKREAGLNASLSALTHISGQSLVPQKVFIRSKIKHWLYTNRIPGKTLVLSPTEVAALYHFPHSSGGTAELIRTKSPELPAPLSLKKTGAVLDVVVGANHYAGTTVPVGIPLIERQKHMYVIGKTGTGKTTLLTSMIYQDIVNGKGVAVFDPHGDMFQELLQVIPPERIDDVIVFDPSDRSFPVGLNILSPGIDFQDEEDAHEWITSSILAVFAKLTEEKYWGPRMEHILRNACLTALQTPNPSLYTLQRLLTDKKYQKTVAVTLKDPVLKQFWQKEFSLLGDMQLSSTVAPLTQRLGHFITTKMSRHILLQEKSSVSMSRVINDGKILLVNLSKGDLGEDQSAFFGTLLTSMIWMAAYQRTKTPEPERRDFFLYVDEFQNFATERFSEITSEGRKFHVSLIASHQNIAQIDDTQILKIVAGNASTILSLKSSPDDEQFILPFMEPAVKKGEIVNLPPYHFFMKMTTTDSEYAFSGQTIPHDATLDPAVKESVFRHSREQYATPRAVVEEHLEKLFGGEKVKPNLPKKAVGKNLQMVPKRLEEVL